MPKSHHTRTNENIAVEIAEKLVPRRSAASRFFWLAPSLVCTKNDPMTENTTPTAAIRSGRATDLTPRPLEKKAIAPRAHVDTMDPT